MYNVTIRETSKELSKKEKVALKTAAFESLDKIAPVLIHPAGFAVLDIVNDEAENSEYTKYIVYGDDGQIYATGSEAFFRQFRMIFDEMDGEPDWDINVIRQDSRKREGKYFLTCVLV